MSENKVQDIKVKMDGYISKLCKELRQGYTDSFKQYLTVVSVFHKYSFGNQMLIAMQMPSASRVAGYNTWKKLNRQVKAGEKSIKILAPIKTKRVVKKKDGSDEEKFGLWFRAVSVFDLSQTEGEELPNPFEGIEEDRAGIYMKLKTSVEKRGISVEEKTLQFGVMGVSYGGRVEIDESLGAKNKALVLIHEIAHELLKHSEAEGRLLSRGFKECQAEATAYIVAAHFGENSELSRDYLLNWGNTEKELKENLSAVIKASQEIINMLTEDRKDGSDSVSEEEEQNAA